MRSAVTILISWLAAAFAILLVAFVATNPGFFTDGTFLSYNSADGVLTFLGETFLLPQSFVESVLTLPGRCAEFYGGFLTDAVREFFASYAEAVQSFWGQGASFWGK